MSDAVPHIQRLWLVIMSGAAGRLQAVLSLMPPSSLSGVIAALPLRGLLPGGDVATLQLVSDPSADPTLRGPAGPAGPQGVVGPAGPQGVAGAQGPAGPVGATGPAGAAGATGAAGPQGATGPQGAVGATGAAGATGPQGAQGVPGATALATVTVGETVLVAVQLGVRQVAVAVPGAAIGDALLACPASALPAGYGVLGAAVTAPGTVLVSLLTPALAVGTKYSIPLRVVRLNI